MEADREVTRGLYRPSVLRFPEPREKRIPSGGSPIVDRSHLQRDKVITLIRFLSAHFPRNLRGDLSVIFLLQRVTYNLVPQSLFCKFSPLQKSMKNNAVYIHEEERRKVNSPCIHALHEKEMTKP